MDRPELNNQLDSKTFREYYYLKEELIDFCRRNGLQTTGGKIELTERISKFLDTGERSIKNHDSRRTQIIDEITLDSIIENNLDTYMSSIEEYKNEYTQDSINEYLEELKDFYSLDYDITYEV